MYAIGCRGGLSSGHLFLFPDEATGAWGWKPELGEQVGVYKVPLPYGIKTVDRPVSTASYTGRTYITGMGTYNMVLDEHHRLWKQGIRGPEVAPVVAGADGTGAIAYTSWYDEMTYERSPLSAGTVISTATPRTWTLPARPPDDVFVSDGTVTGPGTITPTSAAARTEYLRPGDRVGFGTGSGTAFGMVDELVETGVNEVGFTLDGTGIEPTNAVQFSVLPFCRATHIELWLSIAGGLPQLVMKVPIGTTTVVESTAAAEMGESFIGAFERFPRCSMNVIWNDRQLMAGDPDNPDTVYMSELFLPERWGGLSFRTRDGAPVTGMLALRDYCLVFARDKTYVLQGYTESDFTFHMVEQSLGSVGHLCNSVVHGSGYIWTEKGPYMFNGSWHPLSPENSFRVVSVSQDSGATHMRGVNDPDSNTYMVLHQEPQGLVVDRYLSHYNYVLGSNGALVFDYTTVQPETGGTFAGARLSIDTGESPAYGYYYLANKWGYGRLYSLNAQATDGLETIYGIGDQSFFVHPHLRLQDMTTYPWPNIPDTWILEPPDFVVICGHYYFQDGGWTFMEGKTFQRLWFDLRSYTDDSTMTLCPGDDDALEFYFGRFKWSGTGYLPGDTSLEFTVPPHNGMTGAVSPVLTLSPDGLTGRGLSFVFRATKLGYGASFRGFGGAILEGPATRYGLRKLGE